MNTGRTKIARDIFPHDRFEDELYANAVGVYAEQAKSDEGIKKLIQEGVSQADTIAQAKFGFTYKQVANERDRVHVLQSIEASPFFKKIRGDLVVSLYNQPAVWAKLGYQGPSAPFGGYIKRGFNDQNWMDHL